MSADKSTKKPKIDPETSASEPRTAIAKLDKTPPGVLAYLAAGFSIRHTAKACGVCEKSIYRRLKTPDFLRRLEDARNRMIDASIGALTRCAAKAGRVLYELLSHNNGQVRLGAVRAAHEFRMRAQLEVKLAKEIYELRQLVEDQMQRLQTYERGQSIEGGNQSPTSRVVRKKPEPVRVSEPPVSVD